MLLDMYGADLAADKLTIAAEKELLKQYKVALDNIRKEIATVFEKYASGKVLSYADMNRGKRLAKLDELITKEVSQLSKKTLNTTDTVINAVYSDQYYRMVYAIERGTTLTVAMPILNRASIAAAVTNPFANVNWKASNAEHLTKLKKTVFDEFVQGVIQGKGYAETARAIKKRVEISATQAKTIVWTETHRVHTQGRLDGIRLGEMAAKRHNLVTYRVWDATLDGRTRLSHGAADGQKADKNGKFTISGILCDGPGLVGVASEDINCRCRVRFEIEGYEPQKRRVRDEGIVDYVQYDNWLKKKKAA